MNAALLLQVCLRCRQLAVARCPGRCAAGADFSELGSQHDKCGNEPLRSSPAALKRPRLPRAEEWMAPGPGPPTTTSAAHKGRGGRHVVSTIAEALLLRDAGTLPVLTLLTQTLEEQQALLVLDNFEQVIGAASTLTSRVRNRKLLGELDKTRNCCESSRPCRCSGRRSPPPGGPTQPPPDAATAGIRARRALRRDQCGREVVAAPATVTQPSSMRLNHCSRRIATS